MSEVLYLIPGLLCDSTIWGPQIVELGRSYDVRVPDLTTMSSIEEMARTILAGAPGRLSVVGHSMGGRVALEIARLAPARVARLALLDTGVNARTEEEISGRQAMLAISETQGMAALARHWLPPMVSPANFATRPALRHALFAMVERMSPAIHAAQITALLDRPDARPVLPGITCPVLVGVGDDDLWSPPEQHRAIAAAIPHATFVLFPDSGHMAPLEAPGAVTAALTAWMATPLRWPPCSSHP